MRWLGIAASLCLAGCTTAEATETTATVLAEVLLGILGILAIVGLTLLAFRR